MAIKLELFRIFADKKIFRTLLVKRIKNSMILMVDFSPKMTHEETMIDSMLLHRGSDQLLEIIYKSGKNRLINLRLIESYHYKKYSKEND